MSNEEILDIPAIQKNIKSKHQKFVKDFGPAAEKVMADHRLFADMIIAKLYRIALIFKEEKVIDEAKIVDDGYSRKQIRLSLAGNVTCVNIVTNGLVIVLEGYSSTTGFDTDFQWPKEKFYHVNASEFDWNGFAVDLLDYIHATIYERKEAMETRLTGMFSPSPFDESVKTIDKTNRKSKNGNK